MVRLNYRLFSLCFVSLALAACGGNSSPSGRVETKTFSDQVAHSQDPQADEYEITMVSPDHIQAPASTGPQRLGELSAFGKGLYSVQLNYDARQPRNKVLELRSPEQDLVFQFETKLGKSNTFQTENENKTHLASGTCEGALCDRALIILRHKETGVETRIQYVRSIQYLSSEDLSKFSVHHQNDELVLNAIRFGFPVVRHSARVDFAKDLEMLIIEAPQVDEPEDSETSPGSPSPRLELGATGVLVRPTSPPPIGPSTPSPTLPQTKPEPGQSPIKEPVRPRNQMNLTRNPFDVYDIELPEQLFRPGTVIHGANSLNPNFLIKPVSLQQDFEPAFRIRVIAEAMVHQRVKIYRSACNLFVRAVMALAGYLNGPWPLANDFENLFYVSSEGLSQWRQLELNNRPYNPAHNALLQNTLAKLLEDHAVVIQIERQGRNGHVGLLTKEGARYHFYDASLDDSSGSKKRQMTLDELLQAYPGQWRLISYPNLITGTSRPI